MSLLIQWIGDVARNFKLPEIADGLEGVDILWKGAERRQFRVRNSHRKQLKIEIGWQGIVREVVHHELLRFGGTECEDRWVINDLDRNGFSWLTLIFIRQCDLESIFS